MPTRYLISTSYPTFFPITDLICFENPWKIPGNLKYWVLSDISGKPDVLHTSKKGRVFQICPYWKFNSFQPFQRYAKAHIKLWNPQKRSSGSKLLKPSIHDQLAGNTQNNWEWPRVQKVPGNTRSFISTVQPDLSLTRYPFFFYFEYLSCPDIEKPYPLGTVVIPFSFYLSRS